MADRPLPDLAALDGPARSSAILGDVIAAARAPPEAIARRQSERLARLLRTAQRMPFYRNAWRGHDPLARPLSDLPAVRKTQWMAHFAEALADPGVTLSDVQAFCADPKNIGQPYLGRYWIWESSGSTGQPGYYLQDATAMAVYDALESTRRHSPRPWVRLFDPFFLGERLAFVGATSGHFASYVSLQRLRAANPWLAMIWRCFSILQPAPALVAQLEEFAPTIVATYPTAAFLLAEEARHGRLHVKPHEIWTGGETLTPAMRQHVEQRLGSSVLNSYGASEFLPIAWECGHGRLHVNADWVILEPVDASDRPVPAGQRSHTTLLTNLANHVQPLVRFDIGDQIVLGAENCPCGSALPVIDVQGRNDDVLVVPGRGGSRVMLLPLALTTVLEDDAGLFDFQLRQVGERSLCLMLGPGAPGDRAARERCRRLLADFAAAQGAEGLRIVTQVGGPLPLERSGKRKRIIAAPSAAAGRGRRMVASGAG